MKEYVKKFDTAASANDYSIVNIPFMTSVATNPVQNLTCNQENKKIVVDGQGNISIVDAGPVVPNNEIWYTTTDDEIYDLGGIIERLVGTGGTYNGPTVVSNEYDEEMQMWRMTFNNNVTALGDINLNAMTAYGPFFVTYQEYRLACNVETIILPAGVTRIGVATFYGCESLTSVTIPNSVTSIGSEAFYWCTGLTSVTIPNSVTSIENYAFRGCTGLTSITIPNSVTSIGSYAFYGCTGLTSITIPNSVTDIGSYAFHGCSSLTSVTIPNSVTEIGERAFWNCSGLTSVTIPNSITSIGVWAFGDCKGLTSIEIPNSVTSIGDAAFFGCESLTSVTIPNSVTSIGEGAFEYCTGLTSVTIGNSVTSIGNNAFSSCIYLTFVVCEALIPPTCGQSAFDNTNDCPIYVPANSVDAYKAATNWSTYASRIQAMS